MLKLNNLRGPKNSHKNIKRIGRGQGSGQGTQAGKGDKGQKSRSGGGVRLGFEGGQMPIYRRVPKKGFSNEPFKVDYAVINLESIAGKFTNQTVTKVSLIEKGLLKGGLKNLPVKILAKGDFAEKLNFLGIDKFSKKAQEAIEKNGGKIE